MLHPTISIRTSGDVAFSETYLNDRERMWKREVATHGASKLWNGIVYYLRSFTEGSPARVELGMCEYKDLVLKGSMEIKNFKERYPNDIFFEHALVTIIPRTIDDQFVFGEIGAGTYQKEEYVDLIGGTLNQDQIAIENFDDIVTHAVRELAEETGFTVAHDDLLLERIVRQQGKCCFLFRCDLPVYAWQIESHVPPSEMQRLLCLTKEQLVVFSGASTEEFNQFKTFHRSSI